MAAAKVFAVPELLEAILICVGDLEQRPTAQVSKLTRFKKDGEWWTDLEDLSWVMPSKTLFAAQRVNKNFQNSVKGSSKVQRLMLLSPISSEEYSASRKREIHHSPVFWLFTELLPPQAWRQLEDHGPKSLAFAIGPLEILSSMDLKTFLDNYENFKRRTCVHGADASWRRIPIGCTGLNSSLTLELTMCLQMIEASWPGKEKHKKWLFSPETVLGEVFDKYEGSLKAVHEFSEKQLALKAARVEEDRKAIEGFEAVIHGL